jgi:hypothetical protein
MFSGDAPITVENEPVVAFEYDMAENKIGS